MVESWRQKCGDPIHIVLQCTVICRDRSRQDGARFNARRISRKPAGRSSQGESSGLGTATCSDG